MGKKSSNEARMLGVIPSQGADPIPVGKIPDDATQVATSAGTSNGIKTVYTVTSGKTLYVSGLAFSISNTQGASQYGYMFVTDDSDVTQYLFFYQQCLDDDGKVDTINLIPPLEIGAGWKIKVFSVAANVQVYGFVHGYEV